MIYLIRLGGMYNQIEIENNDGDIIISSGHKLGLQAEVGLMIHLSKRFSLLPSVKYRSLNRDIKIENVNTSVNLNYQSVGFVLVFLNLFFVILRSKAMKESYQRLLLNPPLRSG